VKAETPNRTSIMHLRRELIWCRTQGSGMNVHITALTNVAEMNHFVTPKPGCAAHRFCYAIALERLSWLGDLLDD
jgi:hypothetical protein